MMFHGTYTSDFYRSVRGLLHEQITLQTRDRAERAERALEGRWQELMSSELQYRSPRGRAAEVR
jgi:anaerobic magnesium-protoporphyrin IX monomethyl ester cyclase